MFQRLTAIFALAALTAGCSTADRLAQIGAPPHLTPVASGHDTAGQRPIVMPMPRQETPIYQANSLWAAGSRSFFKDQRASRIGDIVTVRIDIADQAQVSNQTTRSRKSDEKADLTNLLGLETGVVGKLLPDGYTPSAALDIGSDSATQGAGAVNRSEKIALTVAAVVSQVLPNGNLVVEGRQEVRINFEVRELTVSGIVRPEDVSATNEIKHSQLAEARISYGGRGQLTDMQQPRLGAQVVDILFPF
ncbi:MAG TPA: flagellar basal body L-ring protein [Alphaproteobacteria bacterium]|nr:flagellar basal body L-ring protein [Alphaproteobacteria bacterium]HAJ48581.1 flagellar basal body L-ring protein [Alphaproteobacteria bacterium]